MMTLAQAGFGPGLTVKLVLMGRGAALRDGSLFERVGAAIGELRSEFTWGGG
jgi:hypothetical protein